MKLPERPELRVLDGVEPSKVHRDLVTPAQREPKPPANLSTDQRRAWDEAVAELRDMGLLYAADAHDLANYARCVALAARLATLIFTEADLVTFNSAGTAVAHPLLIAYDRVVKTVHTLAGSFGLHPAGRAALHLAKTTPAEVPDDDNWERHFRAM